MPGVEMAALGHAPPFGFSLGDPDSVVVNPTDDAYFSALGLRVVTGRGYTAAEVSARAPVAVVSERVAREFWGDENPVGASVSRIDKLDARYQVIGVVADSMAERVHGQPTAMVYIPGGSPEWAQMTVRAADPRAIAGNIREALRGISEDVRPNVLIVADRFAEEFARPRHHAGLAAGVALLTLVLSIVGLTGVTLYSVRLRTSEIGIRMALGARRHEVLSLLVRDGMRPVIIGLVAGLICAILTTRFISGMLYGLSPLDPVALCAAVAALLVAELTAVILPTRRAATLDPARVLRES
jgi:putative ABC transport system permease protein